MCKYKVNNKWMTKKDWKSMVYNEYSQIMKYQELSIYGKNKKDEEVFMNPIFTLKIDE